MDLVVNIYLCYLVWIVSLFAIWFTLRSAQIFLFLLINTKRYISGASRTYFCSFKASMFGIDRKHYVCNVNLHRLYTYDDLYVGIIRFGIYTPVILVCIPWIIKSSLEEEKIDKLTNKLDILYK